MKRTVEIGVWMVLAVVFMVLWGFTSSEQSNRICNSLYIDIKVVNDNMFITKEDIEVILRQENAHPVGKQLGDVDLNKIELRLEEIPEVREAKVYKNLNGEMHIVIEQRNPIVRVFNANGTQFYLDEEGYQMPLSDNDAPRVPVVTGYINDPATRYSVAEIMENEVLAQTVKSDEVYTLVKHIRSSEFWNAQIQQINFNVDNDIELIPTLGSHLIVFGGVENMEGKLNKLKLFYTEGLNHSDWNVYDTINVKFKNQIICSKK